MATLTRIFVYPVKGLAGIELRESALEARGLRHDRRWMLVDDAGVFLSQRSHPQLACVRVSMDEDSLTFSAAGQPALRAPLKPEGADAIEVQIWRSACLALPVGAAANAWFTGLLGKPCRLVYMPDSTRRAVDPAHSRPGDIVSFADGYPVLAISEASLGDLNARLQRAAPMNRFRPNLVVNGVDAYAEDRWAHVALPEAALRGAKPCGRCSVPTVDQATGVLDGPEPLRTLATYRREDKEVIFGQNLLVDRPGTVRVGDALDIVQIGLRVSPAMPHPQSASRRLFVL